MMVIAWIDQLLNFAGEALWVIRRNEHYPALMRWARRDGAELLGGDLALAQGLAPLVWNQTPLVRTGFTTEPLALPLPNESCWCDSGRRYQDCCANIELPAPLPENLVWMLSLCQWRGQRFTAAIESQHAPLQALLEAAIVEGESGQSGRAIKLLEALYDASMKEGFYAVQAFEQLESLYQQRGFYHKQARLLTHALEQDNDQLKGAVLERFTLTDLENDDLAAARANFEEAQRFSPNAPMLAYLETMLLLQEGQALKARARAAFWHRRLARQGGIDDDELDFIAQLASDPSDALVRELIHADEELAEGLFELRRVLDQMPIAMLVGLKVSEQGELAFRPSASDMQAYGEWARYSLTGANVEVEASLLWESAADWLPALNQHPNWLASPLVFREVATALASRFGNLPWMSEPFIMPLVRCFENWLSAIEKHNASMPWRLGQNQAIHLCGLALVSALERGARAHSRQLAVRLFHLDESDPLGLRELVLEHYLNQDDNQAVIDLCETADEPDSVFALMECLAQALAHYRLGDHGRAQAQVQRARKLNRYALGMLVDTRIYQRRLDDRIALPGSMAEAWQARLLLRDCWAASAGALDWLGQQRGRNRHGR